MRPNLHQIGANGLAIHKAWSSRQKAIRELLGSFADEPLTSRRGRSRQRGDERLSGHRKRSCRHLKRVSCDYRAPGVSSACPAQFLQAASLPIVWGNLTSANGGAETSRIFLRHTRIGFSPVFCVARDIIATGAVVALGIGDQGESRDSNPRDYAQWETLRRCCSANFIAMLCSWQGLSRRSLTRSCRCCTRPRPPTTPAPDRHRPQRTAKP